jgi:hypothetical protein
MEEPSAPSPPPLRVTERDESPGWKKKKDERPAKSWRAPRRELSPQEARWEDFEKADYPGRLALFQRTLDEGLMDGENAFAMIDQLFLASRERGEIERFLELCETLRRQAPEAFEEKAVYFLSWQIEIALVLGREDLLPELTTRLASHAGRDPDTFHRTLERLEYHGRLDLLLPLMRQAWPVVRDAEDILDWAIDEYADTAIWLEICAFLDDNPQGVGTDAALLERVGVFAEDIDAEAFAREVDLFAGRHPVSEQLADYQPSAGKDQGKSRQRLSKEARGRIIDLSKVFMGHARRAEGVPWTRAMLARDCLVEYLLEQADPREREGRPLAHPLCPERASLDRFLARRLQLLSFQVHLVLATFGLLPAWLRFLRLHNLLTDQQHRAAFEDLGRRRGPLTDVAAKEGDPRLGEALSAWDRLPG